MTSRGKKRTEQYRKIVPDGEKECIWASAGVVPYKLCGFNFDCDTCAFDQVMRGGHDVAPTRIYIRGYKLCPSLFYHSCHMWARIEENGNVRIGVDDFGQGLLGGLQSISIPKSGERLTKRCLPVRGRGLEIALRPPIAGHVIERNLALLERPALLNEYPYDSGWIALVRPIRLSKDLRKLHYGGSAEQWYEDEIIRLSQLLAVPAGIVNGEIGATMQDGGTADFLWLEKIQPRKLKKIFERFFHDNVR